MGAFLCLQILMAIVAIVKASGIVPGPTYDHRWSFIWQQIEACVAVSMLSLTAFRSIFTSDGSQGRKSRSETRYNFSIKRFRSRQNFSVPDEEIADNFPSIPSTTLTGMRTYIQGGGCGVRFALPTLTDSASCHDEENNADNLPLCEATAPRIKVTRVITSRVDQVRQ